MLLELAIVPAARLGLFHAMHGELVLVEKTPQPIYDGARELLALGIAKPETVIRIRHRGEVVLAAEVGELARWTIALADDGRPRRVLWQPPTAAAA